MTAKANIVALCEGVRDALNGYAFSEDFTAVHSFNPNFSPIEAKELQVIVTDGGGDLGLISRQMMGCTDTVDVIVLWRVDASTTNIDPEKMNRALILMDGIAEFLIRRQIADYSPSGIIRRGSGEGTKQHYMKGDIRDRLFAAAISLTYRTKIRLGAGIGSGS